MTEFKSDLQNGASMPIDDYMGPTLEERLVDARDVYARGFGDIMDHMLEQFILPEQKAALCRDAAQFVLFLMCIKTAEAMGAEPNLRGIIKHWWPIEKAMKSEMPGMIAEYANAIRQGETA